MIWFTQQNFIRQFHVDISLVTYQIIVNYIASTKTTKGLKVACEIDDNEYATGVEISDKQMEELCIYQNEFHGEWNYSISPQ